VLQYLLSHRYRHNVR